MRIRCRPNDPNAANYYGRGIRVCPRWDDYAAFLADMGEVPPGLTIDRIDNDRGYEPGNCRWATMATQRRNQRRLTYVELNGSRLLVQDAAEAIGVTSPAIWQELKRTGGTPQDAFDRVHRRHLARGGQPYRGFVAST
jgi:hypothetical protein